MKFKIKDFKIKENFGRIFVGGPKFLPPPGGIVSHSDFMKSYEICKNKFSDDDNNIVKIISDSMSETGRLPFDLLPQEIAFIENNKLSVWCDYLVFRYKMRFYQKQKKVSDFPVYLLIEPTSACNLRCVMCFQCDTSFTKKPYMGVMSLDFFKKVIDEAVAGGTKAITLASRGEPTLNKNIGEMLKYTKDKFFEVKVNTNGTKLTEKICHEILDSGVTELVWSIDAPKKDLYEKIRVRGNFDVVIKNILMFNSIREKHYPNSKLKTTASGVMFHEEQDIDEFNNFFGTISDNVAAQKIENRWNTYINEKRPDITSPCEYLWERMYVWFDGICNPCDVDYKSFLTVGNINESSIKEIWHGETYTKLRTDHKNKERSKWNPCDRCGLS